MRTMGKADSLRERVGEYDSRQFAWIATLLLLFLRFFTPFSSSLLYGVYSVFIFFCALFWLSKEKGAFTGKSLGVSMPGLLVAVFLIIVFSPYSKEQLFKIVLLLFDAYIIIGVIGVRELPSATRIFYIASSVVIALTFLVFLISPGLFAMIPGSSQTLVQAPIFFGLPDNNDSAFVVFVYFCLAFKKRWKFGIALGLLFPFLYFGRQYILMVGIILVLYAIYIVSKRRSNYLGRKTQYKSGFFYSLLIISTMSIMGFSYYWVANVSSGNVSQYKATLNDSSNAIRMNSNVYNFELILENKNFIIFGYDDNVFDALGISDSDFSQNSNYLVNGIYRLVQPHEEVLNTLLKEGLLFTIFYYGVVCRLLSSVRYTKKNKVILIAYGVGSLVLSSYFRDFRLLALLVILLAEEPIGMNLGTEKTWNSKAYYSQKTIKAE